MNGDILSHQTLYQNPEHYCAWPALVRAGNGDLLLAYVRTEQHLAPAGCIVTQRSTDNGDTWSEPTVAYSTPLDDRECGLTVLPTGQILLHVWTTFWKTENYTCLPPEAYPPELITKWINHVNRPAYQSATAQQGSWSISSTDHGHTWSAPVAGPDSIHGGIALQSGGLLIAGYRKDGGHIGVYQATRPAGPWQQTATVHCPTPDTHQFGEPHAVQLRSGRILLMIRYTARAYDDQRDDLHLWVSYSDDAGLTWSAPLRTPLLGFPPHLLELQDGRILCAYGYRRRPFGERAALSDDGLNWDIAGEVVLRDDSGNHDLGYPASIELRPGEILTVYYQKSAFDPSDIHRHKPAIMATRWRVPARR